MAVTSSAGATARAATPTSPPVTTPAASPPTATNTSAMVPNASARRRLPMSPPIRSGAPGVGRFASDTVCDASVVRSGLQDLVGFAVDPIEFILGQIPVRALLAREPLGADRVSFIGHRVIAGLLLRIRRARLFRQTEVLGR